MKKSILVSSFLAAFLLLFNASASPQNTAFSYQGRLNTAGTPVTGIYDFQFTLYDSASGPGSVGSPQSISTVSVTNGLFSVTLDFGAGIFTGPERWLEIGVRTNNASSFTVLPQRQPILPTPYAITAANLSGSLPAAQLVGNLPATQLSGVLPSAQLSGIYSGVVSFTNIANSFSGSGGGLTNIELSGLNSLGGLSLITNFDLFSFSTSLSPGPVPFSVAAADFNNDGFTDLVIPDYSNSELTVLTNNQAGSFVRTASPESLGGSFGFFVMAADLNADLKMDLVSANDDDSISVLLGNGDGTFQTASNYPVGSDIAAGIYSSLSSDHVVAIADLNLDTYPDLIVADYSSDSLIILNGSSSGVFSPGPILSATDGVGSEPFAVFAIDVNNDGTNDLVSVNAGDGTITALINDGFEGFTAVTPTVLNDWPSGAEKADVNGDGKLDLITANSQDTLAIMISNGDGTFTEGSTPAAGSLPSSILALDVNHDGAPDLVSSSSSSGTVTVLTVLTNIGDGTFVFAQELSVNNFALSIAAGDFNDDLAPDFVTAALFVGFPSPGALNIFTNNRPPFSRVQFVGDGAGLLNLNAANVRGNLSDGVLSPNVALLSLDQNFEGANTFYNPNNYFAGDGSGLTGLNASELMNGSIDDGMLSFNVALLDTDQTFSGMNTFSNPLNSFAGDGSLLTGLDASHLTLGSITDSLLSPHVALLNGSAVFSGKVTAHGFTGIDLRNVNAANAITWTTNYNAFSASDVTAGVGVGPSSVIAADVDRDGRMDLISANAGDGTLSVLVDNGCNDYVLSSTPSVGNDPSSVVAAYINGDNDIDLISANHGDNSLSVLINDGSGGFALSSTLPVGDGPASVIAVDVDGDGDMDLVCANENSNTITVLLGDGLGGFTEAVNSPFNVGTGPVSVVAADINGDEIVDLICANSSSDDLTMLLGDGVGGFTQAINSPYSVGAEPSGVVAADFNGDGKMDLITANHSDNSLSVLINDGSGGFSSSSYPVGNGPASLVAGDLNPDGNVDLICVNEFDNTITVLFNDGSGGIGYTQTSVVGAGPISIAAADLNFNEAMDLITANASANSLTVLISPGTEYKAAFLGDGANLMNLIPENMAPGTAAIDISGNAATATTADNVTGNILDSQLSSNVAFVGADPQAFSGANSFNNPGNSFTGDGSGLNNLNGANITTGSVTPDKLDPTYGYFYLQSPFDNPFPVFPGADIQFPQDGPVSAGVGRISLALFNLSSVGVYEVTWQVGITEPGQLVLALNGVEQPQTVVGRSAGNSQIMGNALIETTVPNSFLSVRNPIGNAVALTVTQNAGGNQPSTGSLVIKRIK